MTIRYLAYTNSQSANNDAVRDLYISLLYDKIGMGAKNKHFAKAQVGDRFILRANNYIVFGIITEANQEDNQVWAAKKGCKWDKIFNVKFIPQEVSYSQFKEAFFKLTNKCESPLHNAQISFKECELLWSELVG